MVHFIAVKVGDGAVAEDLVQDIFVRLLQSRQLMMPATLPALVFTMARNAAADWLRRRRVIEEYEHFIMHGDTGSDSAESVFSARELTERMEYTLARLAPECREVYRLHIYDGMAVSQIAKQTGQPYRHVEYRLGIARQAVRRALSAAV
ncbi:MAG: sigma-70 family RNA polymerase sigma factor [Prevotella sp.]|nr:sigma-70 family RNA polymerase sigma factor [Prevotella sp.]